MLKFFVLGVVTLVFISCGSGNKQEDTTDTSVFDISTEKWPKKTAIQSKAMDILKNWPEFNALETSFDALYSVENKEDLKLVIEDLIEKQKLLADSKYPEPFDISQIRSRQKVFKTYILKAKNYLEFQQDSHEPTLEMINAYNGFRNHFNIIVNNTLDTKLILEEG
ncbi:hypothetical protein [Ulvibacterium marinum]|uniref:Uncharacterized protein n=1 Tax=Ulvibacterium marinum TaxID=2419782 RepID=A0A3B0CCP8_9FLAO|nr:hypothetical protein [Ulvibacterium marinum]RKN82441.1 hypothetical protein D7Z94_00880 [Ulvibacterium marinum]